MTKFENLITQLILILLTVSDFGIIIETILKRSILHVNE